MLYLAPLESFRKFNKLVTEIYIFIDFSDIIFDTVIMRGFDLLRINI